MHWWPAARGVSLDRSLTAVSRPRRFQVLPGWRVRVGLSVNSPSRNSPALWHIATLARVPASGVGDTGLRLAEADAHDEECIHDTALRSDRSGVG